MKHIKLMILAFAIILFTACGSDNTTVETLTLQEELTGKEFYVIEDSVETKNIHKMYFDENISYWNIKTYAGNYDAEVTVDVNGSISVVDNKLVRSDGFVYEVAENKSDEHINLTAVTTKLVSLKMFTTAEEAEEYYNISLLDRVKDKTFFVVRNDLEKRSLFKITFNEDATQWDIVNYDNNFTEDSNSSSMGLSIIVTNSSLTDDNGVLILNSVETDIFRLVSSVNSNMTLSFYETSENAINYYQSFDLRTEMKGETFYAVENNSIDKKLVMFVFDETLSTLNYSEYTNDYNETEAVVSGKNITLTEDILYVANTETSTLSMKLLTKHSDYIELEILQNLLTTYRLYKSAELAKTYYSE